MADQKPTTNYYRNLGGINQKASEYSLDKAQFLNLRNMDFDVPNALQKRPGSTQMIGANTSGPINSLFEFVKLTGESYVIAGSDTAMFYMSGTSLTILDPSWNNGQPTDMLTFVNKLWLANGQNFKSWSGAGATMLPAGLPIQTAILSGSAQGNTAPAFSIFGVTMGAYSGIAVGNRAYLWGAYATVRADGYISPLNVVSSAQMLTPSAMNAFSGGTTWNGITQGDIGNSVTLTISGFTTVPSGHGITALALYFLVDSGIGLSLTYGIARTKFDPPEPSNPLLKPGIDPVVFKFFTLIPAGSTQAFIGGASFFWAQPASINVPFSLMTFGWFDSNTPKYIEVNQNSMFSSGFSQSPSTLWFSELGAPEVFEPESNIEVRTNDGDRIYATKAYNNQLIVLKQNSFHKVIGDSPENFELIELSGEYGCISNQSVIEYQEKLCWLDQKGIVEFNGASWSVISSPVEDIFRRMNLSAAKEKACGVHHLYRNQLWFGIPVDGSTTNNLTVVYDYLVNAWTFFDGFSPSSFSFIQDGLSRPTVWRGDYSGMIYSHGESFYGDNGVGISCVAMPHWDKNKENETWIWRRLFIDMATASGITGVINGKLYSNYDSSTVQGTFSMYQDAFQSRSEIGVPGKAVTAEFSHYSASLPLLVNGYSWAKRFLRNV